ncbi:Mitochondrial outer membrane protein porin [Nymphaea thermarum]|nr:Mitochondrial outer membrane protein porin [Nymphaea thermarum]
MQQRAGVKRASWAASCCRAPRWMATDERRGRGLVAAAVTRGGECRLATAPTASYCRVRRWSGDGRTTWARPGSCGSDEGGECRVAAVPTCLPSPGVARLRASADVRRREEGRVTPGEHLGSLPAVRHQPTHVAEPLQEKEALAASTSALFPQSDISRRMWLSHSRRRKAGRRCRYPALAPLAITTSGTKKGDLFLAVNTQLKNENVITDIKVDTNSKVELQYFHDHGGISTCIGLTPNPIVKFSGVLGSSAVALGTDVAFDTATGNFTMYNGGLSYSNADLIASLNL